MTRRLDRAVRRLDPGLLRGRSRVATPAARREPQIMVRGGGSAPAVTAAVWSLEGGWGGTPVTGWEMVPSIDGAGQRDRLVIPTRSDMPEVAVERVAWRMPSWALDEGAVVVSAQVGTTSGSWTVDGIALDVVDEVLLDPPLVWAGGDPVVTVSISSTAPWPAGGAAVWSVELAGRPPALWSTQHRLMLWVETGE